MSKVVIDPCNGYVRNVCERCVFFEKYCDHPATHYICTFNEKFDDYHQGHQMNWVSALDCDCFPAVKIAHYEPCFGFIDLKLLVSKCRDEIISQLGGSK